MIAASSDAIKESTATMIFAEDVQKPEGPVALPDGTWLIVEGSAERGCVTRLSHDGKSRSPIRKTGRPNGLAVDAGGAIWVAESKVPSLLRLTMSGECAVVATECDGNPFLFPNDLCFGPDGALYLTDSGVHIDSFAPNGSIRPDYMDVKYDGRVYRVEPQTGSVSLIDRGIRFTNGIAFGPDDRLYVNETLTGNIYRYEWRDGKIVPPRELYGNVIRPDAPPGWKGPDGMAFDERGFLYVTVFAQGDVTVLGLDGKVVKRIETQGMLPTNLAFALPGSRSIYVTEYQRAQMEIFPVECDGLRLWDGAIANRERPEGDTASQFH
jgi:gluconolactonase